jgi:hypothetical protein
MKTFFKKPKYEFPEVWSNCVSSSFKALLKCRKNGENVAVRSVAN